MKLRRDKKSERQREAVRRNEAWGKLSYQDQIASLKTRRGDSNKQIAKILARNDIL